MRDRTSIWAGLAFIAVGVLYLMDSLGVLHLDPSIVLPLLLMALGVSILVGRSTPPG